MWPRGLWGEVSFCAPPGEAFFEGGQTTETCCALSHTSVGFNPAALSSGQSSFRASSISLSEDAVTENSAPLRLDVG